MKRRGRPFNHTPECVERQAVFREQLREMKMLSADEAATCDGACRWSCLSVAWHK